MTLVDVHFSAAMCLVRHRDMAYQDGHSTKDFVPFQSNFLLIPGQRHGYGRLQPLHAGGLAHFVIGRLTRPGA